MKTKIFNINNDEVGEIGLEEHIFALEPRTDIVKLVIDWQLAKRRAGTHQTRTVSEVSGTTRKPFKQKGTGNARQGSLRSAQMRGGGVAHGPVTRSHATNIPKKVRKLGLRHALSAKFAEGKLKIVDSLKLEQYKTSQLADFLEKFSGKNYFVIDGHELNKNFALAAKNIPNIVAVPQIGINVYDVVKHDYLLISLEALNILQERLK